MNDPIKENAAETIRELHELGLKIIMMTVDNEGTTRAVAKN